MKCNNSKETATRSSNKTDFRLISSEIKLGAELQNFEIGTIEIYYMSTIETIFSVDKMHVSIAPIILKQFV